MNIKREYLFIAVFVLVVATFYVYDRAKPHLPYIPVIAPYNGTGAYESGDSYDLQKIGVLWGDEYDLQLKDGPRIRAHLAVVSTPEAKDKVVRFINTCKSPRVVLKGRRGNDGWTVDIYLTKIDNGQEINLADWLKQNNLVWE